MVVETLFNIGEEVIVDINGILYNAIIKTISISVRHINNVNVITNRYCVYYKISISNRMESSVVLENKLTKIK
jgi:hypothetical protein